MAVTISGGATDAKLVLDQNEVTKTISRDKMLILGLQKCVRLSETQPFLPIKIVPHYGYNEIGNKVLVKMPYIKGTPLVNLDNVKAVEERLFNFLTKKDLSNTQGGFKSIIKQRAKLAVKAAHRKTILSLLDKVDDFYPVGTNHGDAGLNNFILHENGTLYTYDLMTNFINSPLIDVAIFEAACTYYKQYHRLGYLVMEELKEQRRKIDLIRMAWCCSFHNNHYVTDRHREQYFNGLNA